MSSNSDQNLLFGIIALQMDFVRREQLVAATSTWLTDKSRKIEEVLVEQGALSEEDRQLLVPLVDRHLEKHGGDPQQSLAAMSSIGSVADELRSLGDGGIEATLSIVASDGRSDLHEETVVHESQGSTAASSPSSGDTDARFRVLRSHAKGGLGEVYVAKDTELNREVALKEIQTKYADDENSRLRFLLEAEVTGGLEHPGIVPVYGLGRYEDGRPFYAMRFIKGDSLQEAADRFHGRIGSDAEAGSGDHANRPDFNSLEFRKLLGRFIDVCQAIEYAHSRGVLHRDLKPGNIMLGKYGETLVVDWGLAKAQGRDEADKVEGETTLRPASASGSAPTMMGSAIGTPAFMPPEQATGQLDELGPASDVYSLGATLYYILTASPAFSGKDLAMILEQVQVGNFPSPRDENPRVPKPLNAICLRAMATKPAERYSSPQQLADDIEHFLADEPVSAFAEPVTVKARRWVRKHQTLAVATAAVVLVSVVGLGTFSTIVNGKKRELTESNKRAVAARELAEANEASARQQSQLALTTLTSVIGDIQAGLRNLPGGGEVRRRLLRTSLANLKNVSTQYVRQAAVDRQTMGALLEMGDVILDFGAEEGLATQPGAQASQNYPELASAVTLAEIFYRRSQEIAVKLATEAPQNVQAQHDLAVTCEKLGYVQLRSGNSEAALAAYRQLQGIAETLAADNPQDAQAKRYLGLSHINLGHAHFQLGNSEAALSSYQDSLDIRKKLAASDPQNAATKRDLSLSYGKLGDMQLQLGNSAAALDSYQDSLKIKEKLANEDPQSTQAQRDLAVAYDRLGDVQLQLDDSAAALASYQNSLKIREKLATDDPHDARAQPDLGVSYNRTGDVQLQLGNYAAALESKQLYQKIAEKGAADDPENSHAQRVLAHAHFTLGRVHVEMGDYKTASSEYEAAAGVIRRMIAKGQRVAVSQQELPGFERAAAMAKQAVVALGDWDSLLIQPAAALPALLEMRGILFIKQSRLGEAAQAASKLRELDKATNGQVYNAACIFSLCAASIKDAEGEALTDEQVAQREAWIDEAIKTLQQAIEAGWDDFDHIRKSGDLEVIRERAEFQSLLPKSD